MSVPQIPGYLEPPRGDTLADLWSMPAGRFPKELWPVENLRAVSKAPSGWLTVSEHFFTSAKHGGTGCVLVCGEQPSSALKDTTWIGHDLGTVSIWGDGTFESGLVATERNVTVEFFVQAHEPVGASLPVIDISHPFLWYWDAFPVNNGWKYLNSAGREQELIRYELTKDSWKIEVRALEFRQYLAAYGRQAVIQLDYVTKVDSSKFPRVDDSFNSDWANFDIHILHESMMGERPAFSRLLGQYLITGLRNSRVPRLEEWDRKHDYPTFIYGLDAETGHPLVHTCDPDQLGTYFDKDNSRLHYLTPIYFKREVLQPYASEPTRYSLTRSRLSCLNLWGIEISFNSQGLVEVYLGDLGRDLPPEEWGHWRTYNVPPEGKMDEGRFRRDFLNQPASSRDPMGDLRRARDRVAAASEQLLGKPAWKPLTGEIKAEFDSLIGPMSDDPASLGQPLLVLTKALIDGIDPAPLKAYLTTFEKGDQSLQLLRRFTEQLGDESDVTAILRALQSFRSKGGIAHLAGSQKGVAAATLGIAGLSNMDAFESVAVRATACLAAITQLIRDTLAKG